MVPQWLESHRQKLGIILDQLFLIEIHKDAYTEKYIRENTVLYIELMLQTKLPRFSSVVLKIVYRMADYAESVT